MHHFLKAPMMIFEYAPRYEDYLADTFTLEPESLYETENKTVPFATKRVRNDSLTRIIGSFGFHTGIWYVISGQTIYYWNDTTVYKKY